MIKTTKITEYKDNKKLTAYQYSKTFLTPEYIYVPLFDNNDEYESLVKEEDIIKIGQVVAISKKFKTPIHSSIAGTVISLNKKMWTNNGKLVNCIEIKNNYQEETLIEYDNKTINRETIIKSIKESGIIGMGGAGFPTSIKYNNDNIETLIINACECEPFITCDYRLIMDQTLKLINGIHYALLATNAKEAIIAIKKDKHEAIELLNEYLDEKIKIYKVPNKYPVGWERYLVNKIKKKNYNKLPTEVNCIVSNVSTIIAIDEAVKYNKPLIERMVTITGYCLNAPINVYCKIGTNVEEIINYISGIKHKYHKKHLTAGGAMTGKSIASDNLIVTKTLNSVIINPYLKKQNEIKVCIGCGKCSYVCPSKLTPTQIMKNYSIKNTEELKQLKAINCVSCGLCSYICPSRIDLTYFTTKAKELILRGNYGK